MPRLPLELAVTVTNAEGRQFRWDANQPPANRPRNMSFGTKIGEGFSDASLTLPRRIDLDYPDLDLVNDVSLVGADGSVAYEGRISALPRELGASHSIGVTLTGWMAHLKDRKFTEVYVDRDPRAWTGPSRGRKIASMAANVTPYDPDVNDFDPTDGSAGVSTTWTGAWSSPFVPRSEAWYDVGPGNLIGKVAFSWRRESTSIDNTVTSWSWNVYACIDDKASTAVGFGEQRAAGPVTGQVYTFATPYRYALLLLSYAATPAGADVRYGIAWSNLAVYGAHNLALHTGEPGQPQGVYASDVIANIVGRWAPLINTSGVQATSYVIQHLAFKDRTYPYDALLEINKYHLWHLGVWENKTLHFRPYDLTDYVWEMRTDDPGTTFAPNGESVDDLYNGVAVTYTDALTGVVSTLTPDTNAELADASPENPWNRRNINHWSEITLSTPTIAAQALQLGRAALADQNRPKTPGTITISGYVRDRAGNEQPVWKIRAGDTIAITNYPNDSPRLIVETRYDDDTKTATLSIDRPFALLDAYLDRVSNALGARGLV